MDAVPEVTPQLLAEGRVQYVLTDCVGGFWDIAPALVVREAGGFTTDARGEEPRPGAKFVIASSDPDHSGLREELAAAGYADYAGFR